MLMFTMTFVFFEVKTQEAEDKGANNGENKRDGKLGDKGKRQRKLRKRGQRQRREL